jgi:hypothetical protein
MTENTNHESGVAVTLSILILSAMLAIALGSSAIILREIRFARESNFYVRAFFAADSGIEKVLTNRNNPSSIANTQLENGAVFRVTVVQSGTDGCSADNFCIESIGEYQGTKRAIEVNY